MRIKKIEVKNFKRFTDLVIDEIPETAKLVLLIGGNGSGKSSVFDAFELVNSLSKNPVTKSLYYRKKKEDDFNVALICNNQLSYQINSFYAGGQFKRNSFYGRTSFRQVPFLTRTSFGQNTLDIMDDGDRPKRYIDPDIRFENDIENIIVKVLKDVYSPDKSSNEKIKEAYIVPINRSFDNIFETANGTKLQLTELIPPLDGEVAQITFKKGESEIHYDNLSAGEKEVFNILLNLLSRKDLYTDTIYFFDEMDLHLNTKLQFNLLKEITENWIPENCQLWTASHSLGFIEYAKQNKESVIIDFDELNFDLPQLLSPSPKDNPDVYEIAVGKDLLPSLFQNMNIYFVENKDNKYYATIGIPRTVFVPETNRDNVFHKVRATGNKGIVDRDYLSDDDIQQIRHEYPNLHILNYYSIENYMYHPDNLEEYNVSKRMSFDKQAYIQQLKVEKNKVKGVLTIPIASIRQGYPYFKEPEFNENSLQKRFKNNAENFTQTAAIVEYRNSDDLEIFYKSLPMKDYCTSLPERQNIEKSLLVKTNWFKNKIEEVLK